MKITTASLFDRLPADQSCLAAVFTSYAFDPRVFEEQILRAVLDLKSDPANQTPRFLVEGRARLQATPVSVLVDARQRLPGRRMPYDILEVDDEVFHPKATLLLYEDHARLQIGSGNITQGGYGDNVELFVLLELRYDDSADAALLRQFDGFLGRCAARVRYAGSELERVREELGRRLPAERSTPSSPSFALIDSTLDSPTLDQIFAQLPEGAKVRSIGMLAPFFETDTDTPSIFDRVLELAGPHVELDVGMAWDNPSPVCSLPEVPELADRLGQLWCWRNEQDPPTVEYLVPTDIKRTRYECEDQRGEVQRWSIEQAEAARASKRFWPVGPLDAFAPARMLRRAAERFARLKTWLFPAIALHEGLPRHRPLHAKLIVVGFEHAGTSQTLVVVGSANLSRAALLRKSDRGGNVECGLAFCLEGLHRIHELAPTLVHVPLTLLELRERQYPDRGIHFGLCIERAVHDPAQATLDVIWDRERSASAQLPAWELRYVGECLASGEGLPADDLRVRGFALRADCAELVLHVDGREFAIPILVTDLALLPVRPVELTMSLQTMLLMLGGRLGRERAAALEEQARLATEQAGEGAGLESIFGEGFGPVDVFRAWWGACAELGDPSSSVAAFRVAIVGALGLRAVWAKMQEAAAGDPPVLPRATAWFYGAELLRELERIPLGDSPTGVAKKDVLTPFVAELRGELSSLAPGAANETFMRQVLEFYGVRP